MNKPDYHPNWWMRSIIHIGVGGWGEGYPGPLFPGGENGLKANSFYNMNNKMLFTDCNGCDYFTIYLYTVHFSARIQPSYPYELALEAFCCSMNAKLSPIEPICKRFLRYFKFLRFNVVFYLKNLNEGDFVLLFFQKINLPQTIHYIRCLKLET